MDLGKAISSTGDLLFEFAASLVLIPKTLIKVLINPTWATDYLTSQASEKVKARFEKYSHPILFWIVVGILPYFFFVHLHFIGYTEGKVLEAYKSIGATNIITSISVFLVSYPVSCAYILQLFKHKGFTKSTFKRSFFIQLYITAPVQLFYIATFFVGSVDSDWTVLLLLVLLIGIMLWFLIAEISIIKKELELNVLVSFCIFILMYLIFFVFATICCVIFFMINMESIQVIVSAYFADLDIMPTTQ